MTFTINNYILQINFIIKILFDPQHTEKKHQIVYIEGDCPFSAQILNKKLAFSPATVVIER